MAVRHARTSQKTHVKQRTEASALILAEAAAAAEAARGFSAATAAAAQGLARDAALVKQQEQLLRQRKRKPSCSSTSSSSSSSDEEFKKLHAKAEAPAKNKKDDVKLNAQQAKRKRARWQCKAVGCERHAELKTTAGPRCRAHGGVR